MSDFQPISERETLFFEFAKKYNHIVDDLMDAEKFAKDLFLPDATFQLGNFPLSKGPTEIAAGANGVFNVVKNLKHETKAIHASSTDESCFIIEGYVTYTLKDGNVLTPIPLCAIHQMDISSMKIKHYQAYLDISPLFAAISSPQQQTS